jgi:TrmH family RNA methyltransferase
VLELQKAAEANPLLRDSELYVTEGHQSWSSPFRTHVIGSRQMEQIADTRTPQGIVALVPMRAVTGLAEQTPTHGERAIYLHEIQDPGNLGTILRTLAWFGGFRCLLSPNSVDPFNAKVVRASMGAIFHVPLESEVTLDSLPARFPRIACLDMTGASPASPPFRTFDCYLFGNEARGVPRDQLDSFDVQPYTIAGCGTIESLNLATVVNMCVYELSRLQ